MNGGKRNVTRRYVRFNPYNPDPRYYRRFFLHHVKPPYVCEHCGEIIDHKIRGSFRDGFVLHHIDHDHNNVSLQNLMPLHRKCHPSVHNVGMTRTDESKQRMSESQRRYYDSLNDDERQALSERARAGGLAAAGPKHKNFGELQRQAQFTSRMRTCECGLQTNAGSMGRHSKASGHELSSS